VKGIAVGFVVEGFVVEIVAVKYPRTREKGIFGGFFFVLKYLANTSA